MRSGRDSFFALPGSTLQYAKFDHVAMADLIAERIKLEVSAGLATIAPADGPPSSDPLEQWLDRQIDRLRDQAPRMDATAALRSFLDLLDELPGTASGTIRFRVKANIGHRYLALDDGENAAKWLLDAFDEAPADPRAAANRALAYFVRGDPRAAYDYAVEVLRQDPTNKSIASYLPQFAVLVPEMERPLADVPPALRACEEVAVGEVAFYRNRDARPMWWELARRGVDLFPASKAMAYACALADLDEITRDERLRRTQLPTDAQRERMGSIAKLLDDYWIGRLAGLGSRFEDGVQALVGAMVAHHVLGDHGKAIERATRIADSGVTDRFVLQNAVIVVLSIGDAQLGRRLIGLRPNDPDLAFHSGYLDLQDGRWDLAAKCFAVANVPEFEREVVDCVYLLAKVRAEAPDAPSLEAVMATVERSPRALVMVSRVATQMGDPILAERAYRAALACMNDDTHMAGRMMVAGLATDLGSPSEVIEVLDGHVPVRGFEREHAWLAVAHANERPHRPRNLRFFEQLPPEVRATSEMARAHASVLLDLNRVPEAFGLLRRLHRDDQGDTYVTLRLVEAMRRSGQGKAVRKFLRSTSLAGLRGAPEHAMMLIAQIAAAGNRERAYEAAYDLVRKHPDRPVVALGYVGLGLRRDGGPGFHMCKAGPGAFVVIEGPAGATRSFAIDDGREFFGIPVEPPDGRLARLIAGREVGETFEIPKMGFEPEVWTIRLVHGKYLQLHHRILEEFEIRFPGAPGLVRFTMEEGDVSEALALVRRTSEHNERTANFYTDQNMPLAVVARVLGGDPVGFAHYVRMLDADIRTCTGDGRERDAACATALAARGRGAVLDPYTAWVAAEMDLMPTLQAWFGKLHAPQSCLRMIDRMIDKQREGIGHRQMTMSWHQGQFYRDERDDDFLRAQIAILEAGRAKIVEACEIHAVLVPDATSAIADTMLEMAGSSFLDAAFLASERAVPLLTDDAHFRSWAHAATGCEGLWMQPVLMMATEADALPMASYALAMVGLAARRHSFMSLNGNALYEVCRQDDDGLPRFKVVLGYVGGAGADMPSHFKVVIDFLALVWDYDSDMPLLRRKAASGLVFDALLRDRRDDWLDWVRRIVSHAPRTWACRRYLRDWLRGHFIAIERLTGTND